MSKKNAVKVGKKVFVKKRFGNAQELRLDMYADHLPDYDSVTPEMAVAHLMSNKPLIYFYGGANDPYEDSFACEDSTPYVEQAKKLIAEVLGDEHS